MKLNREVGLAAVVASVGLATSVSASAAQVRFNPATSPDNIINLEGTLSATVTQSSAGIDISIPGVDIVLDCKGSTSTESCVITIGAGQSSTTAGTTSSTGSTGSGTGSTSGTSGSTTGYVAGGGTSTTGGGGSSSCDPTVSFGCSYGDGSSSGDTTSGDTTSGGTTSGGTTSGGTSSGATGGFSGGSSSGTSGSGSTTGATGGFLPGGGSSSTDSSSSGGQVAFPNGGARSVERGSTDLGSAGAQSGGGTHPINVDKGFVASNRFTMKSGVYAGKISFVPQGNYPPPDDAALRMWISYDADGGRVGNECSWGGYFEGSVGVGTDTASGCVLNGGGSYWLNVAFCKTDRDDYNCTSSNALTGSYGGGLLFQSSYE